MKIGQTIKNICYFLMLVVVLITSAGSLNYGFTSGEHLYLFVGAFTIGAAIVSAISYVLKQYK
jgi:hypothetical protein